MHSCWCFVYLSKFDENWSCGVELCMNLCSLVVVIDLEHVVVELVLWVPILMNWSCSVKLCMNLCSNVVVVILTYVVVGLMQWVSLKWWIGDEYVVVVESCGNWWIGEFWWD